MPAGVLCWNWMVCNQKRTNVITWYHPRLEIKTGLRCHLCLTSAGGRHGKSEPRSVGVLANAHGITLLLQRTKHRNHNSTKASLTAPESRSSGLPVALSAPRHGDFPRSVFGSKLPVCLLRGHACPAPQKLQIQCNIPSQKRTSSCWQTVLLKLTN